MTETETGFVPLFLTEKAKRAFFALWCLAWLVVASKSLQPGIELPLGLSDMSVIRTPLESASNVTRIWAGPYQGGSGYENSPSGGMDRSFSLVTRFTFP